MRVILSAASAVLFAAAPAFSGADPAPDQDGADHAPIDLRIDPGTLDASEGRVLFASKGCVVCHAVNGVGGKDATPLDAHGMEQDMSPFDLAAKMWAMAPYMIEAQEDELGEQIQFTGPELAGIFAFLHDDAEQHKFTEASLPEDVLDKLGHTEGDADVEDVHD